MDKKPISHFRVAIGAMGQDEFERFMCDLLPKFNDGFERLEPSFNMLGKTTIGKCDAHAYHAKDDTYTAIICTTQQNNLRGKVLEDIKKLGATRFFSKIRRVILCINTPIRDEIVEYRAECKKQGWELDAFSLERITRHAFEASDLHSHYFGIASIQEHELDSPARKFDCGPRLRVARDDLFIPVSRFIEMVDFHSEREWKAIEAGEIEISEIYLQRTTELSGISLNWLKHGEGKKYGVHRLHQRDKEKIKAIAEQEPLSTYMAIDPTGMDIILIVRFSKFRSEIFAFDFGLNFDEWMDDHHQIPVIFSLLQVIDNTLNHPNGRTISSELMREFISGEKHPASLFEKAGDTTYWFDDIFDLDHRYPIARNGYTHYGAWFVNLQTAFRNATRGAS